MKAFPWFLVQKDILHNRRRLTSTIPPPNSTFEPPPTLSKDQELLTSTLSPSRSTSCLDSNRPSPAMTSQPNDTPQSKQEYHGSCLCGRLTYTLTSQPLKSTICHCLTCRKWTGSAFIAGLVFPLSSLKPSPDSKPYIKQYLDTSASGNELRRTFCTECGSTMYTEVPCYDVVSVTRGGLEGGEGMMAPDTEYWTCRKEGWVDVKGIVESFWENT